jgi:hypothetical protein
LTGTETEPKTTKRADRRISAIEMMVSIYNSMKERRQEIVLASLVGYLPAVVAYRTDVAQSLNP